MGLKYMRLVSIETRVTKMGLEELGFAGFKILFTLYKYPEGLHINELKRKASTGAATTYRALTVLFKYQLITEKLMLGHRVIMLTKKGRELAEILLKANEILEEGLEEE